MGGGALFVQQTTKLSLLVQAITGVVGAFGLIIPVSPANKILNQVLTLEMIVQGIEFLFYTFFVTLLNLNVLTTLRYFDWFLSTPTMLFTLAAYFIYTGYQEREQDTSEITMDYVWNTYKKEIMIILVANFFMLLFGLLGELGYLSKGTAFTLGTVGLLVSFATLYKEFALQSTLGKQVFLPIFGAWSLYGIAFLQNSVVKNISYNFLDIIAKNIFGLFLAYQIWQKRASQS
jgi:hypothetical protein